jgi:hypothetical protein
MRNIAWIALLTLTACNVEPPKEQVTPNIEFDERGVTIHPEEKPTENYDAAVVGVIAQM